MKLMPFAKACAAISFACAASVRSPNIIVPRHTTDTSRPLLPSRRYSIRILCNAWRERGAPFVSIGAMTASLLPELARRDSRTFGQRGHFRPDDVGIDGGLAHPRAVAAIAAGHHVLAADEVSVAADPLRDQLRMLDEVRFRLDDTRNQHLAFGQLDRFEQLPLVRVARIGRLERDCGWPRAKDDVDDVGQRHVAMMRSFVVAPAQM